MTDAITPLSDEDAFQSWWQASKYCQVVYPKDGWEQIARDGFKAALALRAAGQGGATVKPWPAETQPIVFMLAEREGVLFDPQGKFHGWVMRQHPDGLWVSVRKLDAVDPEDNPVSRMFAGARP